MKRIHLHITDKQEAALRKLSEKTGLSLSDLGRRALDLLLSQANNKGSK